MALGNMNIGVKTRFSPTVSRVDSNDFLGKPFPRSKLLRLKNRNVIGLAQSNISMYSCAYGSVASLAPKKCSTTSRLRYVIHPVRTLITKPKITTVCRISAACSYCLRPRLMEVNVVPPIPTSVLKAIRQFIIGKVTASPEIASVPTPFPMNILSIRLYSDTAAILMMAGMEY